VFTVFALSIFGWASTKMDESAKYLHATAIMLGASATLLANEHVRVDVLYARMNPTTRSVVDFCGFYLLLLPLMLAILWESLSTVGFSWAIFEGSPDADGLRGEFLLKTLIPVFALLMIAQGTAIATRAALSLRGKEA
jgi:TRAP-type mannitol/chloroaromatic compound transport system permease small subunit